MKTIFITCLLFSALFISSCHPTFEPISYGHDACMHCKMTIVDKRYAAEIVTRKGRAYKFDDIACLRHYISENNLTESGLTIYVADYNDEDRPFLNARQAVYLHSETFKSPMNGDLAAFGMADEARVHIDSTHASLLKWENLN